MNKRPWAFLLYMAADNRLAQFGRTNLGQIARAGITDEAHVVAQIDLPRVKTKRYYFSGNSRRLRDYAIDSFKNIDAGSPAQLGKFLTWAITEYPADHYAVVLWGHGTGLDDVVFWRGPDLQLKRIATYSISGAEPAAPDPSFRLLPAGPIEQMKGCEAERSPLSNIADPNIQAERVSIGRVSAPGVRIKWEQIDRVEGGIFPNDNGTGGISTRDLRQVLEAAQETAQGRIAILGTDACLMNMAELDYEFRCIPLMVGSEGEIPQQSWPYGRILRALKVAPRMPSSSLARTLVNEFAQFYKTGHATQLSACTLTRATQLVKAIDDLADQLIRAVADPDMQAIIHQSRRRAQQFDVRDYVDLCDFCQNLRRETKSKALQDACSSVMRMIEETVIISKHTGRKYARAKGLSIYFPRWLLAANAQKANKQIQEVERAIMRRYEELQFATDTKWDNFLLHAIEKTKCGLAETA